MYRYQILVEIIIYLTFLLTCGTLLERDSRKRWASFVVPAALVCIAIFQIVLFLSWGEATMVLTLLPLTAYLPTILCLHVLSAVGFYQTCAVWVSGLLVNHILRVLNKLLLSIVITVGWNDLVCLSIISMLALALLFVIFHYYRRFFRTYVKEQQTGWPAFLFSTILVFMMFSYFSNSTTNIIAQMLILLAGLSIFLILAWAMALSASVYQLREKEQLVTRQVVAQRQDYEAIRKKMEMGRAYRHDMRHHLAALKELLLQGDEEGASKYICDLSGRLDQIREENWCANSAVNAVLAAYIGQAREAGCTVDADLCIPEKLPFEDLDLCVIFGNALENAINACIAISDQDRRCIRVKARLSDDCVLAIEVCNPCEQPVDFDSDGFPVVPRREGHGIGLRSVEAVVRKYNGVFQCQWQDEQFILQAALFQSEEQPLPDPGRPVNKAGAMATVLLLCFLFFNCTPAFAQALEELPVVGAAVRVVDLRTYKLIWGDTALSVQEPMAEGNVKIVSELNMEMESYVDEMQEIFVQYVAQKYKGYVGMDISYTIVRDDESLLIVRFDTVVNLGGSVEYNRYFILDKVSGQVLKLSDLFQADADYITPISQEILDQMKQRVEKGLGTYFLPETGWSEESCFQAIEAEQNYYIDDEGRLVIVFDEYEVAPGYMGTPKFVIPARILDGLLARPELLEG